MVYLRSSAALCRAIASRQGGQGTVCNRSRGTVPIFAAEKAFLLDNARFAAKVGLSPSAGRRRLLHASGCPRLRQDVAPRPASMHWAEPIRIAPPPAYLSWLSKHSMARRLQFYEVRRRQWTGDRWRVYRTL